MLIKTMSYKKAIHVATQFQKILTGFVIICDTILGYIMFNVFTSVITPSGSNGLHKGPLDNHTSANFIADLNKFGIVLESFVT